ncbi:MAG: adenylate kinase [Candidatus Krumholzibacteriota bacterium]|nr:adenylate kinase [Candidatus Krumholzibacteriota bacterium]
MHIIILGPPGSGKGTQAQRIASGMGLKHLSTGDLLRDSVADGKELGTKARAFMERGLLVPDEIILGLIKGELASLNGEGWILDGFPRTQLQAEALSEILEEKGVDIDHILLIDVDPDVVVRRVLGRRVCQDCNAVYNTATLEEGKKEICGKCGGRLVKRADDEEDTIRRRFEVYKEQTSPVLGYYDKRYGGHITIEGAGDIDEITAEIIRKIK